MLDVTVYFVMAVTGGIGAGKTVFCSEFNEMFVGPIEVIDCHNLSVPNLRKELERLFLEKKNVLLDLPEDTHIRLGYIEGLCRDAGYQFAKIYIHPFYLRKKS